MSIIIGIDHGYYAIKTAHCSFPAGLTSYGEHEPYTRQGLLEFGGCFFVCGSGRQPIQRDKTVNDNYYLLTLAAIAKEMVCPTFPQERTCTSAAAGLPVMPMSQQTAARNSRSAPLPTEICGINAFLPTMHCTVYRHSLA